MHKTAKEDLEKAKKVIREEMLNFDRDIKKLDLDLVAEEIINISYSVGAGCNAQEIRSITWSLLEQDYY